MTRGSPLRNTRRPGEEMRLEINSSAPCCLNLKNNLKLFTVAESGHLNYLKNVLSHTRSTITPIESIPA